VKRIVGTISVFLVLGLLGLVVITDENTSEVSRKLIIFHAGSLAVPFKQICEKFKRHYPKVTIVREVAGSRECARKIADLHKPCDLIASADYTVIDMLLIPEYADWNIKFTGNEMVIAFGPDSYRAGEINVDNWHSILLEDAVAFGRSDPNLDPCGYRSVFTIKLAEKFYNRPGLATKMLAKDRKYIRPKEVDFLALLEVGEIDFMFTYRSVAEQHKLKYITLPDEINLKKTEFADFYKNATVRLAGKRPDTFVTITAAPIVYGISIPKNAPNRKLALSFLTFLLEANEGGTILKKNGQTLIVPSPTDTFDKLPESLKIFAIPAQQEDSYDLAKE